VAKEAGFFERQGLDVNIVFVEGSPRTMQTLIAGESQIAEATGPAVLSARAAGAPVIFSLNAPWAMRTRGNSAASNLDAIIETRSPRPQTRNICLLRGMINLSTISPFV
jgi:hypothetical protein